MKRIFAGIFLLFLSAPAISNVLICEQVFINPSPSGNPCVDSSNVCKSYNNNQTCTNDSSGSVCPNGQAKRWMEGDDSQGNSIRHDYSCELTTTCPTGFRQTVSNSCVKDGVQLIKNLGGENNDGVCHLWNNPFNPGTGNKFQAEVDYHSPGGQLKFVRYYNSQATDKVKKRFREKWSATYFQKLQISGTYVNVHREDGRVDFVQCPTVGLACLSENDVTFELTKNTSSYTLVGADNVTEEYDTSGKLTSITNVAGQTTTITYDTSNPNLVKTVTDSFGRTLTFTYSGTGSTTKVKTITDPDGNVIEYTYYSGEKLKEVIYPDDTPATNTDNPKRTYHYEHSTWDKHLTGITDENGNRYATWDYDSEGRIISGEHAGGVDEVDITYNANGTVTLTDALGASNTFTFGTYYGVAKTSAVSGNQCGSGCSSVGQTQTFDANGFLASRTDFEGNVTNFVNNSRGLQTSRTEAVGETEERTITTEWHTTLRLPTKITDNGKETTFTYNTTGQVLTRTEKDLTTTNTRTTTYTYDSNGNVLTINGPRTDVDDITTFTYSNGNRATMSVDPDGAGSAPAQVTNYTSYDSSGRLLSMTDPNGIVTNMTYDPRGRLLTRTVASGTSEAATTTFEYDGVGNVAKITLPNNSYLSYTYDTAQRLTDIEDNLGNKISYTLDDLGNRTKEDVFDTSSTLRRTQSRVFNTLSQMTQHTGGASQLTVYGYDGNGNQVSILDPLSRTSTSSYDALDRLITSTDPAVNDTTYTYDDRDNLLTVTDTRNLTTTYTYDDLDNLTQLVSPDTGTTTYTYDAAGNRLTQTDARSKTTTYTYDALNRITSITYPDTTLNVSFTYDSGTNGKGRLTGMTDASGTTTYTYDKRGNILSESKVISSQTYLTSYTYDDADNISQITYPSGRTVDYVYNSVSQIKQVNTTLNSNTNIVAINIAYEPFGPVKSLTLGSGLNTTYTFDQDYRMTNTATDNTTHSLTHTYNAANNITAITNNNDATRNQTFTYDNIDRLLTASGIYGSLSYTYDAVGNRLSETVGSNTDTYSYSTTSNQLQTIAGTQARTFVYDSAGNITNDGSNTYSVSDANRMATMSTGTVNETYTYNGKGERVKKVSGSTTTIFHYDQNGNLIAESDTSANAQMEYIYLNGQRLAMIDPNGTGTSGQIEVIVDNGDAATSSSGTWTSSTNGTGDYEGVDVAYNDGTTQAGTEYIIDDQDAEGTFVGNWVVGTYSQHYNGHLRYSFAGSGNDVFTWSIPSSVPSGTYEVRTWYRASSNRATDSPFTIHHDGGQTTIDVNQKINGYSWFLLGTHDFTANSGQKITLSDDANQNVIADAVKLVEVVETSYSWDAPAGTFDVYAKWTQDPARSTDVTYTLHHSTGSTDYSVNQQSGGTGWNLLGTATFDSNGKVELTQGTSGDLVADAIRFVENSSSTTALYYIHTNHLDTPQVITDGSKTVVWSADYEPFGETNITVNTLTNNLRFPGQYADSESGLHYNYFRDYWPGGGRYMQSDPIGLYGGLNTYSYTESNPVNNSDTQGLAIDKAVVVGAVVIGTREFCKRNPNTCVQAMSSAIGSLVGVTGYQLGNNDEECNDDDNECEEIRQEINDRVTELKVRYLHATADVHDLFNKNPIGPFSWKGHRDQFEQKQVNLKKSIQKAKQRNCTYNPEADYYAELAFPSSPTR